MGRLWIFSFNGTYSPETMVCYFPLNKIWPLVKSRAFVKSSTWLETNPVMSKSGFQEMAQALVK
jgi:hypothetical protein